MPAVPVPIRASVRDLLRDLLGTPVTIAEAPPQVLSQERPAYLASYRRDDGTPVAAAFADDDAARAMGAALLMMTPEEANEQLDDDGALVGDLADSFHEVVNILAKLLNSPTTQHVKLAEVLRVPGDVPQDVAGVVGEPAQRVDWVVTVEGQRDGVLTLVAV